MFHADDGQNKIFFLFVLARIGVGFIRLMRKIARSDCFVFLVLQEIKLSGLWLTNAFCDREPKELICLSKQLHLIYAPCSLSLVWDMKMCHAVLHIETLPPFTIYVAWLDLVPVKSGRNGKKWRKDNHIIFINTNKFKFFQWHSVVFILWNSSGFYEPLSW